MRILIIGAGGLGTVFAGYLARAGVDVTLLVKPEHAAAFDGREVYITGLSEFRAPVRVVSTPDPDERFDYAIVCVKGRDTERALAVVDKQSVDTVLSLQNGVKKDEMLVRHFGHGRVLGAVSMVGGRLLRPGRAHHTLALQTLVGELDGRQSPRGERLAAALRQAGLPAACVPEIAVREWDKLAGFLRTALVCAIIRTDIASALLDPDLIHLCVRIVQEVGAVAAAESHPLHGGTDTLVGDPNRPESELVAAYRRVGETLRAQGPPTFPSLAQDIIAGRPTELEDTAGDVLVRAAKHGISTPALTTCVALLRAIEARSSERLAGAGSP
jgi:2-dehydropantoate 2-reductase